MITNPLWNFSDHVDLRRRELMMAVPNWETVCNVVKSHHPSWMGFETRLDPLGVGGAGAKRASVRITMSSDDADILYNSPVGLRAQYCLGTGKQGHKVRNFHRVPPIAHQCLDDGFSRDDK